MGEATGDTVGVVAGAVTDGGGGALEASSEDEASDRSFVGSPPHAVAVTTAARVIARSRPSRRIP
jgi:hypothetical protein